MLPLFTPVIHYFDSIESTQEEAKTFLKKGAFLHNHAFVTSHQTKGKGRYGRKWESPMGNLAMSFVLNTAQLNITFTPYTSKGLQSFAQLSLIMAIALGESIGSYLRVPYPDLHYKWPNDVLIDFKKIAGILIETFINNKQELILIIGCGVNIVSAPSIINKKTTCLAYYSPNINMSSMEHFSQKIIAQFWYFLRIACQNGFDYIAQKWLEKAYFSKEEIQLHTVNQNYTGHILGLSSEGGLIIKDKEGIDHIIESGEIFYV